MEKWISFTAVKVTVENPGVLGFTFHQFGFRDLVSNFFFFFETDVGKI